ncbi:cellulose synthase subunit BcsC-related outer membrane protein [Celerinatantimonas sp. MCCC 1A17872]|uniref:cellulose biosynthesis protein BcsC n=1 Tax=Celerinatantimonas sp. MCCC 1A17872 TaxID=3177514 RepID=UPI0038C27DB6
MKKWTHNSLKFKVIYVATLLSATFATASIHAKQMPAEINALFEQAQYWHQKDHNDLAMDSLKKVLMAEPNNTQALYLLALWSRQKGDLTNADLWRKRLEQAAPNATQLRELDNAQALQKIPQEQLSLAREQAQSGNIKAAIKTWQKIFKNGDIPVSFAPEYYQTMAADQSLYPKARQQLRKLVSVHPHNSALKLALGKVLSYRSDSRRQGIKELEKLAPNNKDADQSLRQSLLWLAPKVSDATFYRHWMKRHPGDSTVIHYYQSHLVNTDKQEGYKALNTGHLTQAKKHFDKILRATPHDPDALQGLGFIELKEEHYKNAAEYLRRAVTQARRQSPSTHQSLIANASFYAQLAKAKWAAQKGQIDDTLKLSAPLVKGSSSRAIAAKLFRANLLRHNNHNNEAEKLLRDVLKAQPKNTDAITQLYYVLNDEQKLNQADKLLSQLPSKIRQRMQAQGNFSIVRQKAQQLQADGQPEQAIATLLTALNHAPQNPWIRLDLARIMSKIGRNIEVTSIIEPLIDSQANATQLYAGALFASDQHNWVQVRSLLDRIPKKQLNSSMLELKNQTMLNLALSKANQQIEQGQLHEAYQTLAPFITNPPKTPVNVGQIAKMLAQIGDLNDAVMLIQNNIKQGVNGNIGDYIDHISILEQKGLDMSAQALVNNPKLKKNSTLEQLIQAQDIITIAQSDRLRQQGKFAKDYDLLTNALKQSPKDKGLMLAMARLYQSGKMYNQARQVYYYLLNDDTANQDARIGAINLALATHRFKEVQQLTQGLTPSQKPARLLLMARIEHAQGHNTQAKAYLKMARYKLLSAQFQPNTHATTSSGLIIANNPFRHSTRSNTRTTDTRSLPWQIKLRAPSTSENVTQQLPIPSQSTQTLEQVNELLSDIHKQSATVLKAGMSVNGRDGESGLSKLTTVKVPLSWSHQVDDNSRFTATLTSVALDAGASSDDASRRYGTGALNQGAKAASQGLSTDNDDVLPDATTQGGQSDSGVELNAKYNMGDYQADIGTTPLGAELQTWVGSMQWSPQVGDDTQLNVKVERRAVTDSLLSYVGAKDSFTGKKWGQVTRNGGQAKLSFDNGDVGFYDSLGIWRYLGKNVASNTGIEESAGFYLRPINLGDRRLQTGVNLTYMNFDKDLSHFSYGQGGYFSPQHYVSISFPVDFSREYADLKYNIGGALGYQSYSEDGGAYFPTDATLQSELESYADNGETKEAYYAGESHNGIGYNLHAKIDYTISPDLIFGGSLNYDTFGDYNQTGAYIWLKHMLDN